MKFLLKITAFLALLLISKLAEENKSMTPAEEAVRATPAAFTTYYQQDDVPDRLDEDNEEKTQAMYE